jgi:hypothetical protein
LDERKSTFSYVFSLGITPTSWKSRLQNEVVQFNAEIEYRAMNEEVKKANWYKTILREIDFPCERNL